MNEWDAMNILIEIAHSPRGWLLVGIGLVVVELLVPNGYALALALGTVLIATMVWTTQHATWASESVSQMHWLWPVAAWAIASTGFLWIIRRITNPGGDRKQPDVNEY